MSTTLDNAMKIFYFILRAFTVLLALVLIIYSTGFIFSDSQLPGLIQTWRFELIVSSMVWLFVGLTYLIPHRLTLTGIKYQIKMAMLLVGFFWPVIIFIFCTAKIPEISGVAFQYALLCMFIALPAPLSLLMKKY